jgi:hypothetical protein
VSDSGIEVYQAEWTAPISRDIFEFLAPMHDEVGLTGLDPDRAILGIDDTLRNGKVFLVKHGGRIVGSIGLFLANFWYGDGVMWLSRWVYIVPEERNGPAFRALLDEIVDMVEEDQTPAFLHFFRGRPARGAARIVADEHVIAPSGHVLAIQPKGA